VTTLTVRAGGVVTIFSRSEKGIVWDDGDLRDCVADPDGHFPGQHDGQNSICPSIFFAEKIRRKKFVHCCFHRQHMPFCQISKATRVPKSGLKNVMDY
jgi:hypothetical protein